nr:uncharacterized protein LOC127339858 [Lolium perenne]
MDVTIHQPSLELERLDLLGEPREGGILSGGPILKGREPTVGQEHAGELCPAASVPAPATATSAPTRHFPASSAAPRVAKARRPPPPPCPGELRAFPVLATPGAPGPGPPASTSAPARASPARVDLRHRSCVPARGRRSRCRPHPCSWPRVADAAGAPAHASRVPVACPHFVATSSAHGGVRSRRPPPRPGELLKPERRTVAWWPRRRGVVALEARGCVQARGGEARGGRRPHGVERRDRRPRSPTWRSDRAGARAAWRGSERPWPWRDAAGVAGLGRPWSWLMRPWPWLMRPRAPPARGRRGEPRPCARPSRRAPPRSCPAMAVPARARCGRLRLPRRPPPRPRPRPSRRAPTPPMADAASPAHDHAPARAAPFDVAGAAPSSPRPCPPLGRGSALAVLAPAWRAAVALRVAVDEVRRRSLFWQRQLRTWMEKSQSRRRGAAGVGDGGISPSQPKSGGCAGHLHVKKKTEEREAVGLGG